MTSTCLHQPFRVSITGPIGSGKTTLIAALSRLFWPRYNLTVATVASLSNSLWSLYQPNANEDNQTKDTVFLQQQGTLPPERVQSLATFEAVADLVNMPDLELILVEYGGNNLATAFNPALVDATIYIVDITCGNEVIQKGGTGIAHSDLLVLNKTDLAPPLGIPLESLTETIRLQRGEKPFIFTDLQHEKGLDAISTYLSDAINRPWELRPTRGIPSIPVEEQWFWRYKLSRDTHSHFDGITRKQANSSPMAPAPLCYDDNGHVAWDQMWSDFCDLAAAGGPPHRSTLLEPVSSETIQANPTAYEQVVSEIERGLLMVTGLSTQRSTQPGWVGMVCDNEAMAIWLQQAILIENVSVLREGFVVYLPAGPHFSMKGEIKNVITAAAKTHHYWQEHIQRQTQRVS